jgi:hypothetical protein
MMIPSALIATVTATAADLAPVEVLEVRARALAKRAAVEAAVTGREARAVAGAHGGAAEVVESLPGVARAPLGTGSLIIWGAAPEDTRVVVDGVEIRLCFTRVVCAR